MIELTEEQSKTLRAEPPETARVRDPGTGKTYRLTETPAEDYQLPAGVLESMRGYWAGLPKLLEDRKLRGKWVLYRGSERVAVAKTPHDLYRLSKARGFGLGTTYVGRIEGREQPPWEPEEMDCGLIEFEDDGSEG
jgi:hypothetical protein